MLKGIYAEVLLFLKWSVFRVEGLKATGCLSGLHVAFFAMDTYVITIKLFREEVGFLFSLYYSKSCSHKRTKSKIFLKNCKRKTSDL